MPEDDRTDDLVRLVDDESASRVAGERHRGMGRHPSRLITHSGKNAASLLRVVGTEQVGSVGSSRTTSGLVAWHSFQCTCS